MRKILILAFLISVNNYASVITQRCSIDRSALVNAAHTTAVEYLNKTIEILDAGADPLIEHGLKQYFKIELNNPKHANAIKKVKKYIHTFKRKMKKSKYKCGRAKGLWCYGGQLAIVPPPINKIYLCEPYFRRSFEKQVGVIIHEWGHRFTTFKGMAYMGEKYCWESNNLSFKSLARQPDSYMLFIYYLGTNGQGIGCFEKQPHLNN